MPLSTPYALNCESRLVHAKSAIRSTQHSCPRCGDAVILKRGKIMAAHFAHKAESACTSETIAHITAKLLICQAFSDWKAGVGQELTVEVGCHLDEFCKNRFAYPIREKVTAVHQEFPIGSRRVDVMLTRDTEPVLAIEIKVSHAVDEDKAKSLAVYFIEVDAGDVIQNPHVLRDIAPHHNWSAEHRTCPKCKIQISEFEGAKEQIADASTVAYDSQKYKAGINSCYKCQKSILCFDWKNRVQWSVKRPPDPVPRTVQFRYSRTTGSKYWANTCPYCGSIQGDWFSYEIAWDFMHDWWKDLVVSAQKAGAKNNG